jgi:hypothetical protein
MITKQFLKSRPACKLTFELPNDLEADSVELVADVNDWHPVPLKHLKDGRWKLQQEVPAGSELGFRYLVRHADRIEWRNDESADALVRNVFGTQDGVVRC